MAEVAGAFRINHFTALTWVKSSAGTNDSKIMLAVKHTAHQSCKSPSAQFLHLHRHLQKSCTIRAAHLSVMLLPEEMKKFQCLSSREACFCKHLFCFFRIVLNLNFVIVVWAYRCDRGHDRSSLSHKKTIYQYVTV